MCFIHEIFIQIPKCKVSKLFDIHYHFFPKPIVVLNSIFKECGENTYGAECKQSCGRCSNGEPCHHVNGNCPSGCDAGVHGDKCDIGSTITISNIFNIF